MPIEINNVSYIYNPGTPFETKALDHVCLQIDNAEFIGIMGHTGCGKSTLMQLIAGLLTPSDGQVFINGRDINDRRYDRNELRRKVGVVFQYPECQLFETTVYKDVAFGLKHAGLSKEQVTERVRWALTACGFQYEAVCSLSPMSLSGGEKRRVAIAGILAVQPDYLILDEPIAGLDPLGREAFLQMLAQLHTQGVTILMISHNADCIAEYTDRVLLFEAGRLLADGPTANIFADIAQMRQLRLGVSQSREIAWLLSQGGIEIPDHICSYAQLLPTVLAALKGGDGT